VQTTSRRRTSLVRGTPARLERTITLLRNKSPGQSLHVDRHPLRCLARCAAILARLLFGLFAAQLGRYAA